MNMQDTKIHATNVWNSIDEIAKQEGVSLPKLALKAGLDQSTFSHARRKHNWMSLKTLARVLNAHGISLKEWSRLVDERMPDPDEPPVVQRRKRRS
jgi:lambda repressor-like predicted transcriptional regulator